MTTKREPEAMAAWEKALDVDPEDPTARMNRARFRYMHGECPEMGEDLTALRDPAPPERAEIRKMTATCRSR